MVWRRLCRLLALAAVLALAACSAVRVGYHHADTLIVSTLDAYLDLSAEQTAWVRGRAAALHDWHRATQLPAYAAIVERARAKLAGPVTAADVLAFHAAINARLAVLGERAAPDLAELARTLTPAQLDRLGRELNADIAKARSKVARGGATDALDVRVKEAVERADSWLGSVSREQTALLRSALAGRPGDAEWWLSERELRHRELLAVLRRIRAEQPAQAIATGWVRGYFDGLSRPADPERRAKIEAFRQRNAALIAGLLQSATPKQRAHLLGRLAGYADDFAAMAAPPAALPSG